MSQTVVVAKGLTRAEALKAAKRALRRRVLRDFRGFTYDPKTGKAVLT